MMKKTILMNFVIGLFTVTSAKAVTVTCESRSTFGGGNSKFSFNFGKGSLSHNEKGQVTISSFYESGIKSFTAIGTYSVTRFPCPSKYCGEYQVVFDASVPKSNNEILKSVDGYFGMPHDDNAINFRFSNRESEFAWLVYCKRTIQH